MDVRQCQVFPAMDKKATGKLCACGHPGQTHQTQLRACWAVSCGPRREVAGGAAAARTTGHPCGLQSGWSGPRGWLACARGRELCRRRSSRLDKTIAGQVRQSSLRKFENERRGIVFTRRRTRAHRERGWVGGEQSAGCSFCFPRFHPVRH